MIAKGIFKRIISFLTIVSILTVVVFLCFNKPKEVKAEAVAIVGAVAVAGLAAFLASAGVKVSGSNVSGSDYQDILERLGNEFTFDNKKLSDFYNDNNAVNFLIGKDGAKKVAVYSTTFTNWASAFADWLVDQYGLNPNTSTPVYSTTTLTTVSGNYTLYKLSDLTATGQPVSIVPIEESASYVINLTQDRYITINMNPVTSSGYPFLSFTSSLYNANGEVISSWSHSSSTLSGRPISRLSLIFHKVDYNNTLALGLVPLDVQQGGQWIYNQPYSFTLGIPLNSLDLTDITVDGVLTDGYEDFEQALEDAQTEAGTGANARVGTNVGVGDVAIDKPYTQENIAQGILDAAGVGTLTGELTGGYENEKEAEEENDVEKAPTLPEIQQGVVLVNGLEDFFPFCIPFDLFEIIKLLNVAPQAPEFQWKMSFNGIVNDYNININLSQYEVVARVFRIMIIISFLIFLTLKTRDLIRG